MNFFILICSGETLSMRTIKVGHSSNFLYQGFAKKYFLGIYLHSKA